LVVPTVNGEHLPPVVVVGVDGSRSARVAAVWAADEAARRHATLRVVHANLWPIVHPPGGRYPAEYQRSMLDYSQRLVRESVTDASGRHPELMVTSELVTTTPIELMLAESHIAQLVVLGSRGLGGFPGLLIGSVAVAVAGHGHCPLVVVRGNGPHGSLPAKGPVVVGVSGTENDTPTLRFAFETADYRKAPLIVLHTWSDIPLDIRQCDWPQLTDQDAVAEEQRRQLAARLEGWKLEFPNVKMACEVTMDRPVPSLLQAARSAQLLVVGARGRGGFTGMVLGSTSQALLHHSPCPIAVIRNERNPSMSGQSMRTGDIVSRDAWL